MGGRSRTTVESEPRLDRGTQSEGFGTYTDQCPESGSFQLPPTPMLSVGSGGRPFSSFRPLLPKDIGVEPKGLRITVLLKCIRLVDEVAKTDMI
jgi:hypothetical protein